MITIFTSSVLNARVFNANNLTWEIEKTLNFDCQDDKTSYIYSSIKYYSLTGIDTYSENFNHSMYN